MERMSKGREYDRKNRVCILEIMNSALRMYGRTNKQSYLDDAKWFGAEASRLGQRIATHDYKLEDEAYAIVAGLDKESLAITKNV